VGHHPHAPSGPGSRPRRATADEPAMRPTPARSGSQMTQRQPLAARPADLDHGLATDAQHEVPAQLLAQKVHPVRPAKAPVPNEHDRALRQPGFELTQASILEVALRAFAAEAVAG